MKNLNLQKVAQGVKNHITLIFPTLFILFLILAANSISRAQITVDRMDDTATATACTSALNDCSLRGALAFADANNGTTINIPAGNYNITIDELRVGNATNLNTTIIGASAATTIIRQTLTNRRVFNLNPTVQPNVIINISNVTIRDGRNPSNAANDFGGAGIYAGGPNNQLNLTNCIFDNNIDNGGISGNPPLAKGGAVNYEGGGSLTINNCTFINNVAANNIGNRGVGGAVTYTLLNNIGANTGSLTISNSTFMNNRATVSGGAISLAVTDQGGPNPVMITNNTFTGNQATGGGGNPGVGGAIESTGTHQITVQFNRITGNTAPGGGSGVYQVSGNTGTINAIRNWWGCNLGPNNPGCDSILGDVGDITTNPRMVLSLSTSPAQPLVTNQSTTATVSFLRDSANNLLTLGNISRLIGLPISLNPVRGQISNEQTTIQANGTATATFQATSAGTGGLTAIVDNSTDGNLPITINKANTTVAIISDSPDPSVTGQQYTVNFGSVQVTSPGSNSPTAPTGTVTISDGTNSCTVNLSATGCSLQSFTAGIKNLTATYTGDANFNESPVSAPITHTVNKADTTASLSAPSPTVFGQNYSVIASPFPVFPGTGTPTGTISVTDGTNNCTINLPASSCILPSNYTGTRNITATYNGDANYNASPVSNPILHTVNPADTDTNIISDLPDPSRVGQDVIVTYAVTADSPGSGTPTGNVTVSDGTNSCTGTVAAGQCVMNFSAIGNYTLTANYQGSANYNSSISSGTPHAVCQPTTLQVTNNADSGLGSLRQLIADSCPGNVIKFAPNITGQISVSSVMPIDKDLEIQGSGADVLTLAGNSSGGIFRTLSGTNVKISGLTVSNSVITSGNGGAVANNGNLTLTAVVIKDSNAGSSGGGIYNTGNLTVEQSTISNNLAFNNGGGIETVGGTTSSLTVINSTISGNTSLNFGGGIDAPTGIINLINSTITGNRADNSNNGASGGGIYTNSSVSNPVTLRNNIIAGNFRRNVANNPLPSDISGNSIANAFYNLIGNVSSSGGINHNVNGNQVGSNGSGTVPISAVIDTALTDNGGTTPTHKLVSNGLAVDKGSAASTPFAEVLLPPITTDQRGIMRPYDDPMIPNASGGDGSDIGAFEIAAPTAASVSVSGRILSAAGRGINRARVILTMPNGDIRIAQSNPFGYYRFTEIPVGETYIFAVEHKLFTFSPQILNITDTIEDLNFTGFQTP